MNPTPDLSDDPDAIRAEIDRTRERLDRTLDTLAERIKGRHLLDELLGYFRTPSGNERMTTIKDKICSSTSSALASVADSVRSNPGPALLIGAGVTWLIFQSVRSARQDTWRYGPRDDSPGAGYPSASWTGESSRPGDMADMADAYLEESETASEASGEGRAARLKHQVSDAAAKVGQKARQVGRRASELGARAGERSRELCVEGRRQAARTVEEHPLGVGLGCLAAGLLAGLLLPAPRGASAMVGAQAGRLRQRAGEAGRALAERGRRAARAATEALQEETEKSESDSPPAAAAPA